MTQFIPLPITGLPDKEKLRALRTNCLGSLFYFVKHGLQRKRLTVNLHLPICQGLEKRYIKDVFEIPRDHFKSTICTEGLSMWWALPFTKEDEDVFLKLGYPDEYIQWMHDAHNPNQRNLLVSENITNAAKLGKKVRWHFESNALYRALFPETLPTTSELWTAFSLHVNRKQFGTGGSHGEGTFDFIGVGGALQSRHYDAVIQDDLVGKKAIESATVMETSIEYHKLLVGAFDSQDAVHENNELVIGNRWSFHDLNSYIRENETWFNFHSHSALGGCCSQHPADTPIFPEEFSLEKLLRFKARLGSYHFSCQFLNNPCSPEDADFKPEWLKYFDTYRDIDGRLTVVHETDNGIVRKDLKVGHLSIAMAVDPNHSGNAAAGRCRHAIVVVGKVDSSSGDDLGSRFYLLDTWAAHATYDAFFDQVYKIARKWRLRKVGFETVAAQNYAAHHIKYRNAFEEWPIKILELKGEVDAPDGTITRKKEWRIRNVLSPLFEEGRFFVRRTQQDFIGEFNTFPRGRFVDLLDALAYVPQMLKYSVSFADNQTMLAANQQRAQRVNTPYCVSSGSGRQLN
jgi:hypothetical protein